MLTVELVVRHAPPLAFMSIVKGIQQVMILQIKVENTENGNLGVKIYVQNRSHRELIDKIPQLGNIRTR